MVSQVHTSYTLFKRVSIIINILMIVQTACKTTMITRRYVLLFRLNIYQLGALSICFIDKLFTLFDTDHIYIYIGKLDASVLSGIACTLQIYMLGVYKQLDAKGWVDIINIISQST